MIKDNLNKYNSLRDEYATFTFAGYTFTDNKNTLDVVFHFNLADKFFFNPRLSLHRIKGFDQYVPKEVLDCILFNIGMIELVSYWKAACPPTIIIKPFYISDEQIDFWKKIYYNGLGEFFYTNGIKNDALTFVEIACESDQTTTRSNLLNNPEKAIVPVGGGKDSAVTLELLKNELEVLPFVVNPRKATDDTISNAGIDHSKVITIHRNIDPVLLGLNNKGFLNGHTPFSALLGFVALMAAALSGARYITLSNESSANEPTVDSGVNHQYSKSFKFEKDFRNYVSEFITPDIEYFSFLRPLNEYRIASLFSRMPMYFESFRSCNKGSKTDTWCGLCSKCLFVYIILSPFIDPETLKKIIGRNLFTDISLTTVLRELTGVAPVKPFECVGTTHEVVAALYDAVQIYKDDLPVLLSYFLSDIVPAIKFDNSSGFVKRWFDQNHFLNKRFLEILKSSIND